MGRTVKDFQEIMSRQFVGRKLHQTIKGESLYKLAQLVPGSGNIVELGAYRGMGTAALCLGAKPGVKVYTVDDYNERTGWAGEHYDYSNYAYFRRNIEALGINPVLIKNSIEYARTIIKVVLNLVVFDLGLPVVVSVFKMWQDNIVPGGLFAVHDTAKGDLGIFDLERYILKTEHNKWQFFDDMPGNITVFIRSTL